MEIRVKYPAKYKNDPTFVEWVKKYEKMLNGENMLKLLQDKALNGIVYGSYTLTDEDVTQALQKDTEINKAE